MRAGSHPLKKKGTLEQPKDITIQMVNFIPFLNGYFEQSLDVLKLSLDSLWKNTSLPYDLMIFDNGSCLEVRNYLLEQQALHKIQFLYLSDQNVGLPGAWNALFSAAPGKIIAYSDSDIYFYPGWLEACLEVLTTYPDVGMVTGIPLRSPLEFSDKTLAWATQNPEVEVSRGLLQDWDIYWAHAKSTGFEEDEAREKYNQGEDIRFEYRGVPAFIGAGHFQYVAYRSILQAVMPFPYIMPMGNERYLDQHINENGYLRLSLTRMFVRHLGNRLAEASLPKTSTANNLPGSRSADRHWLLDRPFVKKAMLYLYGKIFNWYFIRPK
jgi:glycosyltransferase involved in cell wall biosynthesis